MTYGEPMPCHDCGLDVADSGDYWYMVWDEVWAETGLDPDDGFLCVPCIERRLGRALTPDEFNDAPINRMAWARWRQSPRLRARVRPFVL